jgi:hypothetical protein
MHGMHEHMHTMREGEKAREWQWKRNVILLCGQDINHFCYFKGDNHLIITTAH